MLLKEIMSWHVPNCMPSVHKSTEQYGLGLTRGKINGISGSAQRSGIVDDPPADKVQTI